jgi:dTDP-L-rhamnose 4-epimerase
LADELLAHGYRVCALDNLTPQVHGPQRQRPDYLNADVELIVGDVRDPIAVRKALHNVDAVFHLAAAVGVGQSMYQVAHYTEINNLGTATLLEALIDHPVERLIVASSMSVYGEGACCDAQGNPGQVVGRKLEQLKAGDWELHDGAGQQLYPVATTENKTPTLASVYALSKYDQECLCLMMGQAYGIPTVALRFFNAYGPRQALSNPYTGVLAIFAARLLNDKPPLIFEDGHQQRDFISAHDVARACRLALETPAVTGQVLNVGSGHSYTILEVAQQVAQALGKDGIAPEVTGEYRVGDIRHCFADITAARQVLGFEPQVTLPEGLQELGAWLEEQAAVKQTVAVDRVEEAKAELRARGLTL